MKRQSDDDPYVYPGTETLRNRLDIRDPDMLRVAEYALTSLRRADTPKFSVDAKGYLATHRHLFQDVYDWAGTIRTVGLRNPREPVEFARPMPIAGVLDKQFEDFTKQGELAGLSAPDFASRAGEHLGELNAIHPLPRGQRPDNAPTPIAAGRHGRLRDRR